MTIANVVAAWRDSQNAYIAVSVLGDDSLVLADLTEYVASTSLFDAQGNLLSATALKADLIAAVQRMRGTLLAARVPLVFSGTVIL